MSCLRGWLVIRRRWPLEATTSLHSVDSFCSKIREYFRGVTKPFGAITNTTTVTRSKYSTLKIIKVQPDQPLQLSMDSDWFDVLQIVYFRETGEVIPVTKTPFRDTFETGITDYEKNLVQTFTPLCETTLLRRLVHTRSTPIGASEDCCPILQVRQCIEHVKMVRRGS
jgi:hypothetical protein